MVVPFCCFISMISQVSAADNADSKTNDEAGAKAHSKLVMNAKMRTTEETDSSGKTKKETESESNSGWDVGFDLQGVSPLMSAIDQSGKKIDDIS